MNLLSLKKLSNEALVDRFPYIQEQDFKGRKLYYTEDDLDPLRFTKDEIKKLLGQPILCFPRDHGWFDILLMWSEHVLPYYEMLNPKFQNDFQVLAFKEKYGILRINTTRDFDEEVRISSSLAEYLSSLVCISCGKITFTSNNKKAIVYRNDWTCYCKECSKRAAISKVFDIDELYHFRDDKRFLNSFWKKTFKRETRPFEFNVYLIDGKKTSLKRDSKNLLI
jgi:hypothetical protein